MKNEQGYTITELLVSLTIASLIVGFCFTTYLFGQRLYSSWNKKTELTMLLNRIHQTAVLDVERSKEIDFSGDSNILMHQIGGRTVRYQLFPDSLMRNDVRLSNYTDYKISLQFASDKDAYVVISSLQSVILQKEIRSTVETFPSSKREFLKGLDEIKNKY